MIEPLEEGQILARLNQGQLPYVVVGGFAVIVHGYLRTTEDLDVLVPATREVGEQLERLLAGWPATRVDGSPLPAVLFDGEHHIRARTPDGIIDFIPEGLPPLDFEGVRASARPIEIAGEATRVCDLAHLVAFKRLADRPQDRADLAELEAAHGTLPEPKA